MNVQHIIHSNAMTVRALVLLALAVALSLSLSTTVPAIAQNAKTQTVRPTPITNNGTEPSWSTLTAAQQQALAPLATEWSRMDSAHKSKWLAIGNKFSAMQPEERSRIQNRMREWVKLSPQQRHLARENYWRTKKINPTQKNTHWQEYQQLPEEQKQRLAAEAERKKRVVRLPKIRKNIDVPPVVTEKIHPQSAPSEDKDSSILAPSEPLDTK